VLDFGIAKVMADHAAAAAALAHTGTEITSFTPQYGAPEQFSRTHGATGPWTDVFALALVVAEVVFAPVAVLTWDVHAGVWPFLAASGLLQLAYFVLLATAYRRAPMSVVYPVARGVAPVLVLAVGVLVLGRTTSWGQALGVCLVGAGVLLVRGVRRADGGGLGFGLAIAVCIAAYTLVDKRGVEHAGPIAYLELGMILPTVVYAAGVLRTKGRAAVRAEVTWSAAAAGVGTFAAYALVLAALQRASAASVAAVRETSVLIATVLAAGVLHERVGPGRVLGAALLVAGIAALAAS
jgi:drug/metabolite transporter (DMT)-like permease